jgi:glycine/D-amino acid oxidase-like deaminating enzyme
VSDYDLVVIGGGFAGVAAALSFLETAHKAGRDGRVALIETGDPGRWPGASRWARPFLRLDRDNILSWLATPTPMLSALPVRTTWGTQRVVRPRLSRRTFTRLLLRVFSFFMGTK